MDIMQALGERHSVRSYTDEPIDPNVLEALEAEVARGNKEGGLHMQIVTNDPRAFDGALAHYGKFVGVTNYLVLAGPDEPGLDERCGYYGERVVLLAQQLGLNSCWVALTFKKRHVRRLLGKGDRLVLIACLGHGATNGVAHKSKAPKDVARAWTNAPSWFWRGVDAALLAPTAINQQKFVLELGEDGCVSARSLGGPYASVDLGIVRYHFELGAGAGSFTWAEPLAGTPAR